MKRTLVAGLFALVLAAGVYLLIRDRLSGSDGIAARLDLGCETYLVTQQWQHWAEPYEVFFYVKDRTGKWGRCYIDHQSDRLRNAEIRAIPGGGGITVHAWGKLLASYHCLEGPPFTRWDKYGDRIEYQQEGPRFSLHDQHGGIVRTWHAPEEWVEPAFRVE